MKLAIVIPCRNEKGFIRECVEAIYASEVPENCQVSTYVVDGKSDDGTLDIIEELRKDYPLLEVVTNEKQLTPFAFNLGIKAGGEVDFVQIVGARQIVSKNYFKEAIETFQQNEEIWCVGGNVNNVYLNDTGKIIANAMSTSLGMGLGNFRTLNKSGYVDTIGTPMYPSNVFDEIGYFDEELIRNQDDDFNFRVTQAGKKIFFNSEISLKYYVRGNFKGLWQQFFQYGYWKVYVNKKHKSVTTMRQLVPPLFVLYLLLLPLTAIFSPLLLAISAVPFTLYLLLVVLFSAKGAGSFGEFPQLILTYFILHISYGLGYLNGIITFLVLDKKPSNKQQRLSR